MSTREITESRTIKRVFCDKCDQETGGFDQSIMTESGSYDLHAKCLEEIVEDYMKAHGKKVPADTSD